TLTGTGGVGKTRLAIEAGYRLAERFGDAVVTVWLGTVTETADALPQLARAGDWHVTDERSIDETVTTHLQASPTLVILDNCEQVENLETVIDPLLRTCPNTSILATSRRALGSAFEHVIDVDPLPIPDSIELLVNAARRSDPRFAVTAANRGALTELATRLDGVPLALYLAAARLHVMTPDEMVRL